MNFIQNETKLVKSLLPFHCLASGICPVMSIMNFFADTQSSRRSLLMWLLPALPMMISLLLISPPPHAIVTKNSQRPPASVACRKIENVLQVAVHAPAVAKMITTLP
jgi:hypothetical protein